MPPIDKALFSGDGNISSDELTLLEIHDYGDSVLETLREFKWNNRPVCAVALELSPDNRQVYNGTFLVRGALETKEIRVNTSNLWATAAADTQLTSEFRKRKFSGQRGNLHLRPKKYTKKERIPDGSAFSFDDGSLCSDYLKQHTCSREQEGEAPAPGTFFHRLRLLFI